MDKENIMLMEYTTNFGFGDVEMVAIFNKTKISEYDVKHLIRKAEESVLVVQIPKAQYEVVFGKIE